MADTTSFHMTPDEFRRRGRELVDWIADYYERIESLDVLPDVQPGDIVNRLPDAPPEDGEDFDDVLADIDRVILPGITHWQHPNFHAYFPCNASFPAILGELLSAGLGVQGMLWLTSPACTELETRVLDWTAKLLDLPDKFLSTTGGGGVIQDSASSASLCAMIAARERATEGESNRRGVRENLVVYTSTEAHSSIRKAARIIGIGDENVRLIPVDVSYAMRTKSLAREIADDRAAGRVPFFISATTGTTSSLAMDPLKEIGDIARRENLWLHVDAAMAGTAAACPEFRWIHDGLEHADSYCFNPHKWMFTNFDCDAFYVANRNALTGALGIMPEYLRTDVGRSGGERARDGAPGVDAAPAPARPPAAIDYRDWQIPLGRRFRSLKLWFVLRHYGVNGLRHHIREHVRLAKLFAGCIEGEPGFELVAPRTLNLVCFAHERGDDFTERLMAEANRTGRLFVSHTRLGGRFAIRLCVGQTHTRERHVMEAFEAFRDAAGRLGPKA